MDRRMTNMVIYLLVFFTTALIFVCNGECAWVLWYCQQSMTFGKNAYVDIGKKQWELMDAYPEYDQCIQEKEVWWKNQKLRLENIKEGMAHSYKDKVNVSGECCDNLSLSFAEKKVTRILTHTFHCFPDTVDPRPR